MTTETTASTPIIITRESLRAAGACYSDARIERLVKARFPALTRIYGRAYQELMNRDFFGLKKRGINIDKLPLIDRINIRTKCGSIVPIRFTAQEQVYVDRALATETFAEVEALAEELFNLERARKKPGVKSAMAWASVLSPRPHSLTAARACCIHAGCSSPNSI